jgi:hypothetical protein
MFDLIKVTARRFKTTESKRMSKELKEREREKKKASQDLHRALNELVRDFSKNNLTSDDDYYVDTAVKCTFKEYALGFKRREKQDTDAKIIKTVYLGHIKSAYLFKLNLYENGEYYLACGLNFQ